MEIAIIGTGYVGLVTGTCFADMGNNVTCVDIDKGKVKQLSAGKITIYEPDLDTLFARNLKQGRLHFTTDLPSSINKAKVIFLALPTPPGEDGSADLSYILSVAKAIAPLINSYKIIVDKSTVPVGTAVKVRDIINDQAKSDFDVVANPEFLREGVAVEDFMKPDRVVIGTSSKKAREVMEYLYSPFVRQNNPIIFMDERSAELTKYASNAYLATRITFMNEIANLCEKTGANVEEVRKGMGSDSRIGNRFLFPGIGFGGSCFPKDVKALAHTAKAYQYDFHILQAVTTINEKQKQRLSIKLKEHFGRNLQGKRFAIWGLSFKPNTDDIREAPALRMIEELLQAGAEIHAFDPEAMNNVRAIMGDKITLGDDQYAILKDADALLIATEWPVFRTPDFRKMRSLLKQPVIFDGRNLYALELMQKQGFYYNSIGRNTVQPKQKKQV